MIWILFIVISSQIFCYVKGNVIELTGDTFDSTIANNQAVLVEFYSPGCGHCISFAPNYEKIATIIEESNKPCVIAKINDRMYRDKSKGLPISTYPAIAIYINGTANFFKDELEIDPILTFINKKMRQPSIELKTEEEIIEVKKTEGPLCILVISTTSATNDLHTYMEIAKKLEDYEFYHASIDLLKKVFPDIKEGYVIAISYDDMGIYKWEISSPEFLKFLENYALPAVQEVNSKFVETIFKPGVKKGVCLFYDSSTPKFNELLKIFKEVAKELRSPDYIFVAMNIDDSWGSFFANLYSIEAKMLPMLEILDMKESMWQYRHTGELTEDAMKNFVKRVSKGEIQRFVKSEAEPKTNDGPIYEIVGNTFNRDVLENDKDIVMLFYGPMCDKCDKIRGILKNLAEKLKDDEKIRFVQVDITKNDVQNHLSQVYPTIKLYPAKNKGDMEVFNDLYTESEISKFIEQKSSHSHNLNKGKIDL